MNADRKDFDEILAESHILLRAYIRRTGVAVSDVDDVAQDVYITFYQKMDQIPPDTVPIAYLKGIARNKCLKYFERAKTRRSRLQSIISAQLSNQTDGTEDDKESAIHALMKCVDRLPDKMRTMVDLKYRDGLGSDRIAELLGQASGSIRKSIYRARLLLKKCVSEKLKGGVAHE